MKKFYFLAFIALASFACKKPVEPPVTPPETVDKASRAVIFNFTATWAEGVGEWSIPAVEDIYNQNSSKSLVLAIHSSDFSDTNPKTKDPLFNGTSKDLTSTSLAANAFNVTSYPDWYVNNERSLVFTGSSIDLNATKDKMNTQIHAFSAASILANTKITKTVTGSTLDVRTLTQFYSGASGDYTLSCLITEDNVTALQKKTATTWNNSYIHNHVLRTNLSTSTWGDALISNPGKDRQIELKFSGDISKYNADKIHIVTIIWKKTGTTYTFVNAAIN